MTAIRFTPLIFTTLILSGTLSHITADFYTPSLPAIAHEFTTSPGIIQQTLSIFMLGFSVSHLFYGPLSDRIGRRSPLLLGIILSIVASLICFYANSIQALIAGRFLQGLGVGSCNSVGRTVTRDLLSGSHLARMGSMFGMAAAFITATSPTLGGYVQYYFNWRMNFLFLAIYTFFILCLIYFTLPETNINKNHKATNLNVMLANYKELLSSKIFMGFSLCSGLAYAGIIAYVSFAPFLFQNVVGLNAVQFGWLAFAIAGSFFFTTFLNNHWVIKKGIVAMMRLGVFCMISAGVLMLALALAGFLNTFVIMLPVCIFSMGSGFTFANSFAGAFHPFPHMAGVTGGLFGCLQILFGSLSSVTMSLFHVTSQIPLASIWILIGILTAICLNLAAKDYVDNNALTLVKE